MEVALVRDLQKIHGQAFMADSRLRLLDKNRVELQVETASVCRGQVFEEF